jgi:membrane fusion protein (multidrug efflux system)
MIKRMIIMLALVAIVAAAIIGFKTFINGQIKQSIASSFAPPTVSTMKAEYQDWQPQLKAVGSLRAINGADLSSELAGIVETINFESGTDVEKGTALLQLRAEDDIAKLHALEAGSKLAEINYERDQKQLKAQAVSQAVVDSDKAALENYHAQVAEQQAIIDKKTIVAPFAGRLGVRQVDIGQYLNPGTPIVTLQQLDPIFVDFILPEQALPKLTVGQKVTLKTDAQPDKDFAGTITAINSKVDPATRNVEARATLPNPDHKLLPGMFGTVIVDTDKPVRYITLPQSAIVFNTYSNTVYLVQKGGDEDSPQLTAQQVVIITGETRGDQVAVLSGIKEGDEVVTSGQVKLRNGAPVVINNEVEPPNDPNPSPHEQ